MRDEYNTSLADYLYTRRALLLLFLVTVFRLWFCTHHELVPDEAYYFLWSNHLDASYYSKGPGIAWTIALGTKIAGDTVFGIRWISVILSAGTGWMIFTLGKRLFDARVGCYAMLLASIIPLLAVGSILMTIDPLSVFFWAAAAHLFLTCLESRNRLIWLLLGLCVGAGFLCKFVNAIQLLCFALYLFFSNDKRELLWSRLWFYTLAGFAVCTIPVLWWNWHHGWITATHLKERGALDRAIGIKPKEVLEFLKMQAITASPFLFLGFIRSIFDAIEQSYHSRRYLFLLCLTLPIVIFYFILSFNDRGEANWTATAYVGGVILLTALALRQYDEGRWRKVIPISLFTAFILTVALHETYPLNLPLKMDPITRLRGWASLAQRVEPFRQSNPDAILIGNKYQTASVLSFYLQGRPVTFVPSSDHPQNQFSFWPGYTLTSDSKALLVTDSIDEVPDRIKAEFASIQKIDDFMTRHKERDIRRFQVYLCQVKSSEVTPPVPQEPAAANLPDATQ